MLCNGSISYVQWWFLTFFNITKKKCPVNQAQLAVAATICKCWFPLLAAGTVVILKQAFEGMWVSSWMLEFLEWTQECIILGNILTLWGFLQTEHQTWCLCYSNMKTNTNNCYFNMETNTKQLLLNMVTNTNCSHTWI